MSEPCRSSDDILINLATFLQKKKIVLNSVFEVFLQKSDMNHVLQRILIANSELEKQPLAVEYLTSALIDIIRKWYYLNGEQNKCSPRPNLIAFLLI